MYGRLSRARIATALSLVAVMAFSAGQLLRTHEGYAAETRLHHTAMALRGEGAAAQGESPLSALRAVNPDVMGWIRLENTTVDYPFVQGDDNSTYLRRDLNGEYALAGTIFMDYRNSSAAPGTHTILYGHNMKNDSMFGQLYQYADGDFFAANRRGTLLLEEETYALSVVACLLVDADDAFFYGANLDAAQDRDLFIAFLKDNALQSALEDATEADRFVTLSTCTDFGDAQRLVVVLRLAE